MKAKLIYIEGSSYFGGKNPYNENWNRFIEVNGEYYRVHTWGNYSYSGKRIDSVELDIENLPEEYTRTEYIGKVAEAGTTYKLRHGNNEEIEIDLLEFAPELLPEKIKEIYMKELEESQRKSIERNIEMYPELNYRKILEDATELTLEQREVANAIIEEIETEIMNDKDLSFSIYRDVIINIVQIAKGEAIVVRHLEGYYSRPDDFLFDAKDFLNKETIATSGESDEWYRGIRAERPRVFSIMGKAISLPEEEAYLGSYWEQGYCIDVIKGIYGPYIVRNVYESWNDSQHFEGILDLNLPTDRFEIATGEEWSFEKYNEEVKETKKARKQFFEQVVTRAQETFGLPRKEILKLLKYAGSVKSLAYAIELKEDGLTENAAIKILRKESHSAVKKILRHSGIKEYPDTYKFDVVQGSARMIAEFYKMIKEENETELEKICKGHLTYSLGEVLQGLNLEELKDTKEKLVQKERQAKELYNECQKLKKQKGTEINDN